MYTQDETLLLSGIQHFAFCRRQWALIHIEQLWFENYHTAEGRVMHEKAHNPYKTDKRRDLIVSRDIAVHSSELGISGQCDIVEFHRDDVRGVKLHGRSGKWFPLIVEYKRGKSKVNDCDRLQLTLQAMCLEEMLNCEKIENSCIYYGETKRREYVNITDELRNTANAMILEMHDYYNRNHTPKAKFSKSCTKCSLNDKCLPNMVSKQSVTQYIEKALKEADSQ